MGLYLTEKHVKYKKKGSEEYVSPFFIYHNDNKRTKVFCSLKINNKHWDFTNKKVKPGDKEYKFKNNKIHSVKTELEDIISSYKSNEELLTPEKLKGELETLKTKDDSSIIKSKNILNSKIPLGSLALKWGNHKSNINLVSPSNKRNIDVIVVGTGLAGASASATLAELGAYSAMNRQIAKGKIKMYNRHEMVELVKVDGKARGIIARDLVTGKLERHSAHAVVIASGGYGNVFFLSTNAMGSNVSAAWKIHKKGAYFANPCFTQIHPTCIPVSGDYQSKLTLMSESLRNDGRIWVPKEKSDAELIRNGKLSPVNIPEDKRDYYLERKYPAFGNLVPRDIASRAAKERCDNGYGVNQTGEAVFLDFSHAIIRYGEEKAKISGQNSSDSELGLG